jgi:hypothetical protein
MTIISCLLRGTSLILGIGIGTITLIPNMLVLAINNNSRTKSSGYMGIFASTIIISGGLLSPFITNPTDIMFIYSFGGILYVITYTR